MTSILPRLMVAIGGSIEASIVVKATAVLALALVAARLAPRARASVRHAMFAAAFVVVLTLPMVAALLTPVVVRIPVSSLGESMIPLASREPLPAVEPLPHGHAPSHPAAYRRPASVSVSAVFRAAWTIGALLCLVPFIFSLARIRRIRRDGVVWSNGEPLVHSLAAEAGVRRRVGIVLHHGIVAPMTCGIFRPAIVLPSDAPQWTDADVRHAVVHELEHVRRSDWPIHLVARVVCALYWFHPFVWMAWRRLCLESERACDDAVLLGADETAYADQLVRLARRFVAPTGRHALSMASRSDLSSRISAVLDNTRVRGRVRIFQAVTIGGVALILLLAISPLRAIGLPQNARERFATNRSAAIAVDVPLRPRPEAAVPVPSVTDSSRTSAAARPASRSSARPQVVDPQSSAFEVISITPKPSGRTELHRGPVFEGDEFTALNVQLQWLIESAYTMNRYQLVGGPGWISTDYFDVTAKAHAPASREALRSMLRTLLADRFDLVVHTENRDTPIYALVLGAPDGTLGPNLRQGTADCATLRATAGGELGKTGIPCGINMQIGRIAGRGFGMDVLAGWLSRDARRMVVDKTGLEGVFDFDLTYTPEQLQHHPPDRFPTVDPEGPSLFTAAQEQLGLKLEPQDSLGEVLVIDHVEQPIRD